jgi:hypothetical protein
LPSGETLDSADSFSVNRSGRTHSSSAKLGRS